MDKISLDSTFEQLDSHFEQLERRDPEEIKENLRMVLGQLGNWELCVVSLVHGLNSFGVYMSVTEIAKLKGHPRTYVNDYLLSAYRKLGCAVSRGLLQDATGFQLEPSYSAKIKRKSHKKTLKKLKV